METNSFKTYLQNELISRCDKNPSYSLRAFAKSLKIEPSALSQIIRGKRKLTKKMTLRLANELDIAPYKTSLYYEVSSKPEAPFKELTLDLFEVLSDWYHFAILELMNVSSFSTDPAWIARTLGLTVSEVNISISRLQKLEMLKIDEDGKWHDLTGGKTNLGDPSLTNQAFKRYQRKILKLSEKSLEDTPIQYRDHSGTTMAIDSSKIPEAKELIKEFRRKMGKLLTGKNEDQVYQLQISLYPLSDIKKGE
ncbi:TIGR02147 family protein [Halobacteriovorax sp. GB3]|uniref:TIGR02147 family protein n=1 Tax=Halobacteriovorax sp. GB3 TaxID=2719615 RepID=UPI00235F8119|nr:TIGR02147 family protein [Halobacteriovorax sp. GB3]MDD0854691.1 TIGR02147 family protein [Halobacteriovorax sp. GB3]